MSSPTLPPPPPAPAAPAAPAAGRERWGLVAVWGGMLVLLAILAWPLLRGEIYTKDDLGNLHLPWRAFYADCLRLGESPFWCPYLFGGYDLYGLGEVGMAHPLHWLWYRWLPLPVAFTLEPLTTYAALLVGGYLWLRRWLTARAAAVFGAGAFAFCGFNFLHFMHLDMVAIIAHLPWLLWATDLLLRAPAPRTRLWAGLGVTLFTASQLLLGHPQAFVWSAMAETVYLAVLLRAYWQWRAPLAWALAKALGALLAAVQLWPTWAFIQTTDRAHASTGFASVQSLPPINLIQLVCPYLLRDGYYPATEAYLHEYGAYTGLAVLALALGALLAVRDLPRAWRPLWGFGVLLVVGGLTLALGRYAGVQPLLARLPVFGMFKDPCRHLVLAHLGLALLAALFVAHQHVHRAARLPLPRRAWRAPALLVAASVGVTLILPFTQYPLTPHLWLRLAMPLAALLVGGALLAAWRYPAAAAALALFTAADLGTYGLRYLYGPPADTQAPPACTVAQFIATDFVPPPDRDGRVFSRTNPLLLLGITSADGLGGVQPMRRVPLTTAKIWRLNGVSWVYSTSIARLQNEPGHWVPRPYAMPRARLLATTVAAAADLPAQVQELDFEEVAVVEPFTALPASPPGGQCAVLLDRPGHLRVQTSAPGDRLLVLTERWASGWQVRLDDLDTPLLRAYGDLLAVRVPSGEHVVELSYDPPAFYQGLQLSALGLVLTGLWVLLQLRRSRSQPLPSISTSLAGD